MNQSGRWSMSAWLAPLMLMGAALASRPMLVTAAPIWWALLLALAGVLFSWSVSRKRQATNRFLASAVAAMASISALAVIVIVGGHLRSETWLVAFILGCFTWLLCRSVGTGVRGVGLATQMLTLVAAVILVREIGSEELYAYPTLLLRSVAFGVLLLALVLWVLGDGLRTNSFSDRSSGRRNDSSLLAPALAGVGVLLAILWAYSLDPVRTLETRLRMHLLEDADVTELQDFGDGDSSYFSGGENYGGEGRSLPKRADIELGDALRTVVQIDDRDAYQDLLAEPLYLRTLTLSIIEGEGGLGPLRRGEWRYDSDDGSNDGRVMFDRAAAELVRGVGHTVFLEAKESNALPMLSGVSSIQLDEVYEYADDWFQLALPEGQDLVAFRAVSEFQRALGSERLDPQWVADKSGASIYRQIPATALTEKLRGTARSVVPQGASLAQSLSAIRDLLDRQCRYSLSYENPDDLPAVENFLYAERLGHCEMFAATTVMLLRTLDIPARVAYGYSGGVARNEDRVVAFRDRDLHAWAEVLVQGRGWVVFDTTPIGSGARVVAENSSSPNTAGADGGNRTQDIIPDLGAYQLLAGTAEVDVVSRSWVPDWLQAAADFAALYLTEICLLLLALFMVLWLASILRYRRKRSSRSAGKGSFLEGSGTAAEPGYLQKFFQLWSSHGEIKRSGQTLREFVDALHGAEKCGEEFDGMVNYTYQIRYAGGRRDRDKERAFEGLVAGFEVAGSDG